MLELTFLNVNQGDSIVIHWHKEGELRTIIVDCNLTSGGNKTIQYIEKRSISVIDYIILSHAHYDHYSGIYDLVKYCIEKSIKIHYVLFTGKTQPTYIRQITKKSPEASTAINNLFSKLLEYFDDGHFELASIEAGPNCDIVLNDNLTLTILSPTLFEENKFLKSIKVESFVDSDVKNHPAANWLSTVLKIHTNKWYVLLTADCLKETLVRLDTKDLLKDENGILRLAQSSHHGALSSHNNTFWSKRKRDSETKIVFSLGENLYKHPNDQVVTYFEENLFNIHSTNPLGLISNISSTKEARNAHIHISTFSAPSTTVEHSSQFYGDQTFHLDSEGNFT